MKLVEDISLTMRGTITVESIYRMRLNKPGKIVAILKSKEEKKSLMDLATNKIYQLLMSTKTIKKNSLYFDNQQTGIYFIKHLK